MADSFAGLYTEDMQQRRGFSLTELVIAIAIIALLATLVTVGLYRRRSEAKLARVSLELANLSTALAQYSEDNNYQYPADVSRGIPPGLEKYLAAGSWPISIWPTGVFDYDNWLHPGPGANTGKQVYQISYRLCGLSDDIKYCSDPVLFPNFVRNSSIFYCISGPCIPHESSPTAPGYCVNCKPKEQNY
jgi:prepilin-type N-terminal cleavage/methylation domain-containing protein